MSGAIISAVNYSEVLKKTIEHGGDANVTALLLERSRVDVVSFDERQAAVAAALFPKTRDKGLSFADRACLALAIELKAVLYTADRRLAEIDAPIRIVLVRHEAARTAKTK
jgi:PIN domain nuclease of toxin-antitoxin system